MGFDSGGATQRYPQVERVNHVHHAGNSSGIVDGAAGSTVRHQGNGRNDGAEAARAGARHGQSIGSEPSIMLTGPSLVTRQAAEAAGHETVGDIDLYELNEAFASVVLRFMQALDIPHDKLNVNGGAIAMGHPLGATGCDDPGHRAGRNGADRQGNRAGDACASARAWGRPRLSSGSRSGQGRCPWTPLGPEAPDPREISPFHAAPVVAHF